jgi:uncharacterized protein YlxW (UPF0749 family)
MPEVPMSEVPVPEVPIPPTPEGDGWGRIRQALRFRPSRAHFVVGLLCLVLGFAFAVQVRSTQSDALAGARTSDLVRILDDLGEQRQRLASEAARLQSTLDELNTGVDQAGAARAAARERLATLGILAGTIPAAGPGVILSVADPEGGVRATDLLDVVQELRDAGAEAIQVNDVRVIGSSSFIDSASGIVIDGVVVTPNYEVRAIGDPGTMAAALAIPGGVLEGLQEAGARPSVTQSPDIAVAALKPAPSAEYAHPA